MSVLLYLVVLFVGGLFVGAIGRLFVPGRQPMGCVATSLCGIGGSLVGGGIGRLLFGSSYAPGFVLAVLGSVLVIWVLYGTGRNPRRRA